MKILIISGRSGSGKTTALNLLEDEGFTCIDNLPVSLLSSLVDKVHRRDDSENTRLAVGIDARNIDSDLGSLPAIFNEITSVEGVIKVLYLDTSKDVLIRRFSETRRKHPLTDKDTGLNQAITEEDVILAPLAAIADVTIDTTHLNLHELRSAVKRELVGDQSDGIALTFTSFGFKFGVPIDADYIFDVRCLPNPYWHAELRDKSGRESDVEDFLKNSDEVQEMAKDIELFTRKWLPCFESNNRSYLNVAIGCTGGMHRSVYLAEELAKRLKPDRKNTLVRHRQLEHSA